MNQQFILSPTPGLARRLERLSRDPYMALSIDDNLRVLAEQDLITAETFPDFAKLNEREASALQQLIDCNLRGVLTCVEPLRGRAIALLAAKAAGALPVTIWTERYSDWLMPIRQAGLSGSRNPAETCDVLVPDRNSLHDTDIVNARRHGTLIIDTSVSMYGSTANGGHTGLASEFAKTIIVAMFDGGLLSSRHTRQIGMETALALATVLFPSMPQATGMPSQDSLTTSMPRKPKGLTLETYMQMTNVVTDLIA